MTDGRRCASALWGGALVTLAWIGVDPVALASGRDYGAGFQPAYLFLAAALAARFAGWLHERPAPATRSSWARLGGAALIAVALSLLGLFVAPPPDIRLDARLLRFVKQAVQLIIMFSFVWYAHDWARGLSRWERTRDLLAVGLAVQLAWSVLQAATFGAVPGWFAAAERIATSNPAILAGSEELYLGGGFTGVPRVRGTACEPLYLASFVLMAVPVLLLPGARRRHRCLAAAGALLLLGTWSRGAWLAALAGLGVWVALALRSRSLPRPGRRAAIVAGTACALFAAAALAWPDAALLPWRRLLQSLDRADWSNLTRVYSMQAAWRAWLLSPALGVGWGQFAFHFPALVDPTGLQSQFTWPVVNNFPLAVLCETGLVGFAVLVAAGVLVARESWRGARRGAGRPSGARVALLAAGTAAVWAQLLTFSQYNLPHLWVAPGLLLAALRENAEARDG